MRRIVALAGVSVLSLSGLAATAMPASASPSAAKAATHVTNRGPLQKYEKLVVIYEENHSFDNLYGGWGKVNRQSVNGIGSAGYAEHATQVAQDGRPYTCLLQDDPALTTPPQDAACGTDTSANGSFVSHFANSPFSINDYITPASTTCVDPATKAPAPGGCTRDLVHRFYEEQYQLNGGAMNRYATGSDAAGLTMGHYDTTQLPIYQFLHSAGAPHYVIADNFFQAAFGGSFLNHQYLVAAQAPLWPNAPAAKHSVLDDQGFPDPNTTLKYPLHSPNPALVNGPVTQVCLNALLGRACGDYAVNTVQPANPPSAGGSNTLPLINDTDPAAPNYETNIGDELSAKNVPWAWYAGGWNDAAAGHPDPLFQFHHQPLNYFANYAPGMPGRDHLKDESDFVAAAKDGSLPAVSFIKPIGEENEHPGYASTDNGEKHLVDLVKTILDGPEGHDTLIVVTYDEFGGAWDHVAPPGQGGNNTSAHDEFGPGTRIPALLIGGRMHRSAVDSTAYDTTSILATIEHQFGLAPLDKRFNRDGQVHDLEPALEIAHNS